MLKKTHRLDRKGVVEVFKSGKFVNSATLTFKFIQTPSPHARISFIVPKGVAKLAVKRNLLRRRGYSALEKHFKDFSKGLAGVFIFKKYQEDISVLQNEIKSVLDKIN